MLKVIWLAIQWLQQGHWTSIKIQQHFYISQEWHTPNLCDSGLWGWSWWDQNTQYSRLASSTFFKDILRGSTHDRHWIYHEGTRQKILASFVDLLYYRYANINEDSFSSFLEVAKEFNINGTSGLKSGRNCDFSQNIEILRKSHNTISKDEAHYSELKVITTP